jgi:hypothetical protein
MITRTPTEDQNEPLKVTRGYIVALPSSESEKRISIKLSEWMKIRKKISNINFPTPWFQIIASVALGSAISLLLAAYQSKTIPNFPQEILTSFYVSGGFCFVITIICYFADKSASDKPKNNAKDVIEEMDHIQSSFTMPTESESKQA